MKIIELELILTHSPRKNKPSEVELFSVFYFKNVLVKKKYYEDETYCLVFFLFVCFIACFFRIFMQHIAKIKF